jgi:hypothetical protein
MSHARDTACDMPMMSGEVQSPCPSRERKRELQLDTTRKRDINEIQLHNKTTRYSPPRYNEIQWQEMCGGMEALAWKDEHV